MSILWENCPLLSHAKCSEHRQHNLLILAKGMGHPVHFPSFGTIERILSGHHSTASILCHLNSMDIEQWLLGGSKHYKHTSPFEWWRKPLCLGFVILFCLCTILHKVSARTHLAHAKTHGQTLASASLTRTESSMMLLNVNLASASLPRRLV